MHYSDHSNAYTSTFLQIKPFIGTLLGAVGAIVLIATAIVLLVKLRGSSGRDRDCGSTQNDIVAGGGQSVQDIGLVREQYNDSVDSLDKNPDIIPQSKKSEDNEEDEKGFEWINNPHTRMYTTAAMAEQSGMGSTISYDRNLYTPCPQQPQSFPIVTDHQNYIPIHSHNTLIPVTSMGHKVS